MMKLALVAFFVSLSLAPVSAQEYCEQYFLSDVTIDSVGAFVKAAVSECEAEQVLRVYVSSVGGDPQAALGLHDWLRQRRAETVAMGDVASAAITIFLAGEKRTAYPNTRFLLHPGEMHLSSKYTDRDLAELVALDKWDDDRYNAVIAERTGLPLVQVEGMVYPFTIFGVEQAREWGFVTE